MLSMNIEYKGRTYHDLRAVGKVITDDLDKALVLSAPILGRELERFFTKLANDMDAKHSGSWPNGTTGNSLSKRTGLGLRSIRKSIFIGKSTKLGNIRGRIRTGKMTIHEKGAILTPKGAKFLTIPTKYALDARGVPLKRSAREWKNTFIKRSKAGNLVIFQRRSGREIIPLYVLKPYVRIKPRLGLGKTFESNIPFLESRILTIIDKELEKV